MKKYKLNINLDNNATITTDTALPVPTRTSELTNDSGFITTDTNYYPSRIYTTGLKISNSNGVSNTCELYVPYASTDDSGLVNNGDQTFSGTKTFVTYDGDTIGAEMPDTSGWTTNRIIATLNDIPTVDTAISTSSTNAVQNKAIPLYIASRGENLLTNGTALLGNNYNFSALTYDGSDTYYAGGCFKHVGGRIEPKTDEYMPVDVSQTYEISYWARSSSATSTLYDYLAMYDIDKLEISARHIMWISGSTTTLAQELKNGDTKVYLTSVAGFNKTTTATYQKGLIFWNYTNSFGYAYGTETYSRNVYTNLWAGEASFDTTNNTITLSSAWNKGTIPAGTSVSQSNDGSTYTYMTTGPAGSTNWFKRSATMSGVGKNNESGKFREGTAFVKLGWLIDQNSESNVTWKLSTLSVAKYLNKGSVTSVRVQATSPVVSSTSTAQTSTLNTTISLANGYGDTKNPYGTKTANYVLAGPTSGSAAAPSFRALVTADIPDAVKNLTETTYSALKTLRDNSQLVPGKQYRITDYACTTTTTNTSSAGHAFDIIVVADLSNKLNENARACLHNSGDNYFANSKLEAWQLKYCIDNDTNRFAWADSTNGKGVIYWMKDEFNNECPYDFKNILFTSETTIGFYHPGPGQQTMYRDPSQDGSEYYAWKSTYFTYWTNTLTPSIGSILYSNAQGTSQSGYTTNAYTPGYTNVYTFGLKSLSTNNQMVDASLIKTYECFNNIIKEYQLTSKITLNNCVFYLETDGAAETLGISSNILKEQCHDIVLSKDCSYNMFKNGCNNIRINRSSSCNTFGCDCTAITFNNQNVSHNIFGDYCRNIKMNDICTYNEFGIGCNTITLSGNNQYNIFKSDSQNITLGNASCQNNFGLYTSGITLGNNCYYITIGDFSRSIYLGSNIQTISIGSNCSTIYFASAPTSGVTINYVRYITIGDNCYNFYMNSTDGVASSSNWLQNVIIHSNINQRSGTTKHIEIPDRNLQYTIEYYPTGMVKEEI